MATDPAPLAKLLRQHRPKSSQHGYPQWLRTKVGDYATEQRAAGVRAATLSAQLGVSATSLRKWARDCPAHETGGFAPVAIAPQPASADEATAPPCPPPPSTSIPPPSSIYLTSPQGFSLHGLSVAQAIDLFAGLR